MGLIVTTAHQERKRRKMRCEEKLLERDVWGRRHEGEVEVGSCSVQQSKGGHIYPSYIYTTGAVLDELEGYVTIEGDRRIDRNHRGGFRTRGGTTPQSILVHIMPRLNLFVRPPPYPPGRDPQLQPDMPTLRRTWISGLALDVRKGRSLRHATRDLKVVWFSKATKDFNRGDDS